MKRFKVNFSGHTWINAENEQEAEDLVFEQLGNPERAEIQVEETDN